MLFLLYSADIPSKRIFQKEMLSYFQRTVITFMIIATSADVPHYTQNLFLGHLTITMLALFPNTQFVSLLLLREPNVNKSLNFIYKPEQNPQVSKSQESSPSKCNFKDFENLESLNRNRSSLKETVTRLQVQFVNQVP